MAVRTTTWWAAVLAGAATVTGVLGACGGSSESDATLPAPSLLTTTLVSTTVIPTTAVSTTLLTSTSSSTAPTTSTTIEATTTSTIVAPAAQLVLGQDRLGTALFGADADGVIAYVTAILGPPTADSGWADPNSAFGVCPGSEVRGVTWGDLLLLFSDESSVAAGRRHFFSYTLGPAFGAVITPEGMATPEGIAVGSTVADLKRAYPGVYVYPGDDVFGPYFALNDNLTGYLTGAGDTDTVASVIGGITCGE
jgi:hypothetical protein